MSSSLALAEFRWSTSAPSLVECTREVGTVRTGGISLAVENLGPHELVVHVTTTPGCTLSLGTSWIVPSANGARSVRISPLDAVDGRETVVRVTARSAATLTPARFAYCLKRVGDDYMIDGVLLAVGDRKRIMSDVEKEVAHVLRSRRQ